MLRPSNQVGIMNKTQKIAAIAIVAVICAVGAIIILNDEKDDNVLIVETCPDFPPFDYQLHGNYVGIDMDLLTAVGNELGYKMEFRQNSFDSIIPSLVAGKCDIGANGFTITEERKKSVLFSDPYFEVHQVAVGLPGLDITCPADLEGKTLVAELSTTGEKYAENVPGSKVIHQKDYSLVVKDVLTGKADFEIVDNAVALAQVGANQGKLQIYDVLTDSDKEYYGFLFSKENPELRDEFNKGFAKIQENGIYQNILDYYDDNNYDLETPSYFEKKGHIVVETAAQFPPFEYMFEGSFAGIDMDLVRAMMNNAQYGVTFHDNTFSSILPSLDAGKCDMGASGFSMTPDRDKSYLISDTYFTTHQVIVVKEGKEITKADLANMVIGVQTGTKGSEYAAAHFDMKKVSEFMTYTDSLMALQANKIDCELLDETVAMAHVANHPGLKLLDILDDSVEEKYGFIFKKNNTELCQLVNEQLAAIKESGLYDKIIDYYIKESNLELVPSYFDKHDGGEEEDDEPEGFWATLKDKFYTDFIKNDRYMYIFEGLKNTLIITALALVLGMVLGTVVAMVRSIHDQTGKLKILNSIGVLYTTVIRGTPVMVQLMLIYYVIFASSDLNSVMVASVAFGLNSGAYVAEVVRAGITAVPKGQMEACRSLGMTNKLSMITVILPQAIRNILPALGNEGISLLKETSVAGYIGIMDLTRGADIIRGQTYDALLPMLVAAAIYLSIVMVLAYLIKKMEKRLNNAY